MASERRKWKRIGDAGGGFSYLRVDGSPLRSDAALRRIRSLVIPPAWVDVEIDPDPGAKIQATGYDSAGRKQYRYHPEYISRRASRKFHKLLPFARVLPVLRSRTDAHLGSEGLGRERVLATVVRLMCRAFFRVGSERYAVRNRTFGIATLRKEHLLLEGNNLIFRYVGKGRIDQRRVVAATPLLEVVEEILALPGSRLFRYLTPEGEVRDVTAPEVNRYLRELVGERYTSKDIRTWGGTVRAATILADIGPAPSERQARKNITLACKLVATELGNTPAICRSAYIHPTVLEHYLVGETIDLDSRCESAALPRASGYYPEEVALLRVLQQAEAERRRT